MFLLRSVAHGIVLQEWHAYPLVDRNETWPSSPLPPRFLLLGLYLYTRRAGKAGRGSGLLLDWILEDLRKGLLELSRCLSDDDLDFVLLLGFFLMLLELLEDFAFLLLFPRLLGDL